MLLNWVFKINIANLNMHKYLDDKIAMAKVSDEFSCRLNGVLIGAIYTFDGLVVCIICPRWKDSIVNAVSFFPRKGFYALNVQCTVDPKKRVARASYSYKGGLQLLYAKKPS